MNGKRLNRRDFLRFSALTVSGSALAACAPRVVEVTKEIVKEVPVEQTVIVEKEVEVEREVTAVPTNLEEFELRVGTFNSPVVNPVTDMLIAGFGAKYPNARVKIEYQVGDYAEKMYTMVAAGNLPDVIWTCDVFTFPFARRGVLLDMQPFAETDEEFDLNDVYPSILELGRVAGEPGLYMIPASLDVVVVFYNKTAFERAGAPLPHQ
jgi:ABC-type glycerol-3-phosphate transport system substrate-binding protein